MSTSHAIPYRPHINPVNPINHQYSHYNNTVIEH